MPKVRIDPRLIPRLREYLGVEMIDFFKICWREHGTYSPVLFPRGPGSFPHPVHLREGVRIRNFMRKTGLCEGWDDHDYDNNWVEAVRIVVEEVVFPSMWVAQDDSGR